MIFVIFFCLLNFWAVKTNQVGLHTRQDLVSGDLNVLLQYNCFFRHYHVSWNWFILSLICKWIKQWYINQELIHSFCLLTFFIHFFAESYQSDGKSMSIISIIGENFYLCILNIHTIPVLLQKKIIAYHGFIATLIVYEAQWNKINFIHYVFSFCT